MMVHPNMEQQQQQSRHGSTAITYTTNVTDDDGGLALEKLERKAISSSTVLVKAARQKKMVLQGGCHGQDSVDQSSSNTIQEIQNIATARLEKKFRDLLISHTFIPFELLDPKSPGRPKIFLDGDDIETVATDDEIRRAKFSEHGVWEVNMIPQEAVTDLRSIAEHMIASGYLPACLQAYKDVRKSMLNTSFKSLGLEYLTTIDIETLEKGALPGKIREWINAARVCIRILFANEKGLWAQIFEGIDGAAAAMEETDACFLEIVKGPAIHLFSFVELISKSKRSPDKLSMFLDLHEALMDLLPDIKVLFCSKPADQIRLWATEVSSGLIEAAREAFSEFENEVMHDRPGTQAPSGGKIDLLTMYVMNYISVMISDHKQTLTELITWTPSTGSIYTEPRSTDFPELEGKDPLGIHLLWIIVVLQFNLEGKSMQYNDLSLDVSLAHLFMMNNCHYIVQKIEQNQELREIIGEYYLRKLMGKCWRSSRNYQRTTWARLLHCLSDEGLHVRGSYSYDVSKAILRERIKSFNAMFDKIHKTQATWFVQDDQLREELRISINDKFIPAYRSFIGRFRSHIESGSRSGKYIKYEAEDLENAVFDLFEGSNPGNRRQ